MSGRPLVECFKDRYFCECGFSCRTIPVFNYHKKGCSDVGESK